MKTVQLEKLKLRIVNQVENSDAEEKCLGEYRRELELLMQEKMSHVEELRQIHADINAVRLKIIPLHNFLLNFDFSADGNCHQASGGEQTKIKDHGESISRGICSSQR